VLTLREGVNLAQLLRMFPAAARTDVVLLHEGSWSRGWESRRKRDGEAN